VGIAAPSFSTSKLTRSELMRRVRSRGTVPELLLEQALRAARLRFQTAVESLPGKPDIVFRRKKVAVFVDGEFWHGFQWQKRGLNSLAGQFVDNPARDYWMRKILGNQRRDRIFTAALLEKGWTVLRFWEDEVRRNTQQCVETISSALTGVRSSPFALAPVKTFVDSKSISPALRRALESTGWRASESSSATLSLSMNSPGCPFVLIETSLPLEAMSRTLNALTRRGYGVDALIAGAPRRLYVIGVLGAAKQDGAFRSGALGKFIVSHPKVHWSLRRLPAWDKSISPIAWLTDNYFDPAITEMLRGRALSRPEGRERVARSAG
jgi:DNA mismatch endonuclease (patch repair protein)